MFPEIFILRKTWHRNRTAGKGGVFLLSIEALVSILDGYFIIS
jgi:hypothetical protein